MPNVFVKPDEQSQARPKLCHGEKTSVENERYRWVNVIFGCKVTHFFFTTTSDMLLIFVRMLHKLFLCLFTSNMLPLLRYLFKYCRCGRIYWTVSRKCKKCERSSWLNFSMAYRSMVRGMVAARGMSHWRRRLRSRLPASRSNQPTAFWSRS